MALIVWATTGIALWHFTVFLPHHERFWQGIVGAFLGALIGAVASGMIFHAISGRALGETDVLTLFAAVPGTIVGIAVVYWIGVRQEESAARAA